MARLCRYKVRAAGGSVRSRFRALAASVSARRRSPAQLGPGGLKLGRFGINHPAPSFNGRAGGEQPAAGLRRLVGQLDLRETRLPLPDPGDPIPRAGVVGRQLPHPLEMLERPV